MSQTSRHIFSKMKAFSLEKALKTDSGMQGRLGCLRLPVPTSGSGEFEVLAKMDPSKRHHGCTKITFRTHLYLIHTQTGSVPHITPEVFKLIYPTPPEVGTEVPSQTPPLQVSLDSTIKMADSLEDFRGGIGKFVGFPDLPMFLTIHDPLQALRPGHNDKFGIVLWSRHLRTGLTPERFSSLVDTYKCAISQIISDYDVKPEVSSIKRVRKSLARAEEYTSHAIKKNRWSQRGLFLTVEAAWFRVDEEQAKKTVASLLESQQQVEGILVAGIANRFVRASDANIAKSKSKSGTGSRSGGDVERLSVWEDITDDDLEIVEKIVEVLPSNLVRVAPGPYKLTQMVDLLGKGIDIFDSSVASRMADDAEAFLIDQVEEALPLLSKSVGSLPKTVNESLPERSSINGEQDESEINPAVASSTTEKPVISLKDKRFFDDFGPISKACNCYTCRKHTRSYIHHLYATDELLGPVLVQIHNLTTLDRFFTIMRGVIEDSDSPEALKTKFNLLKKLLCNKDDSANENSDTPVIEKAKAEAN